MPGGQPLRLGPFIGGLNTVSDPTAIADAELSVSTNFELDIDGSLVSRPPFEEKAGKSDWTERIVMLCEGIFSGNHYLIGSNTDGVFYYISGAWTLITNTFQAAAAVQYTDKIYLVAKPGSANPGGKWDPSGGFTAVAAIPKGQSAVIHKERLFIAPGVDSTTDTSRLKFSDAGDFDTWGASNFIDAGQGDGTKLVDLTVFQDNLLLFKEQSSYLLAYDIRPTDAVLRKISSTIGAPKQKCVVNYENQVYLLHNGWVYEIINYDFNRLNTKVPFVRDETIPAGKTFASEKMFITILEDRLICRFFKKIYVYGLRTRTWSEWESVSNILQYFGPIVTIRPSTGNEYYSGSCLVENKSIIKLFNESTTTSMEKEISTNKTITCTLRTKNFDMSISHQFKRLWWWGADITTDNDVVGIATPIVLSFNVSWGDLSTVTWGSLASNTWAQPQTVITGVQTTVPTETGTSRRFVKFLKSLRYRQINFEIRLTTNGSSVDGPARLFTITAITESKQIVSKAVS